MTTQPTIRLPLALPHQLPILLAPARFKVVACGRRWGKSAVGLMATVKGHGPSASVLRGAAHGATIWWVAPTFGVASLIWRDLKKACRGGWTEKSEREHRIDLPGNGSVSVRSADNPDLLRGPGLDGVVMDEAAFLDRRVWREALRPALSDRQGWAIFISTPNGRNWFSDLHEAAADKPDWSRWRRPSSENPLISAEELNEALSSIGLKSFEQEYEAGFMSAAGAEFDAAYFHEAIWFDDWPPADRISLSVIALDPSMGRTENSDFSAYVMLRLDATGTMWVDADIERRDIWRMIDDGVRLAGNFRPDAISVEINQFQEVLADVFAERLRDSTTSLPLHGIHNRLNKRARIRATLTSHLAHGRLRFKKSSPGCQLLVQQLQAFPLVAHHDDGPDALEMAVRLAQQLTHDRETQDEEAAIRIIAR